MFEFSHDNYVLTVLWQSKDFVKFSQISLHLALIYNFSFVWQSNNILTNVFEFSHDNYVLTVLWQSKDFKKFSQISALTWKLFMTFPQYKWLKASNNDQQSRLLYIYKHFCLCVSSVVEITKLYLFIYVPVFWLSIIFIHSNFPLLNILSRWTLKSYFHGECQQPQCLALCNFSRIP